MKTIDEEIEECRIGWVDDHYEVMRDVTVFSRPVRRSDPIVKNLLANLKL